jgi:hypothetical protein
MGGPGTSKPRVSQAFGPSDFSNPHLTLNSARPPWANIISDPSPDEDSYNHTVRRVLSFTLLLLFSLPLISPVLALTASSDANLPACCRRNGAHHCTRVTPPADSSDAGINLSAIPQHCPGYPAVVTSARHGDLCFHAAALIFAGIISHPTVKPQTQARARVALDISRQKRGPPTDLL